MGDIVDLRGQPIPPHGDIGNDLTVALARFSEGLLTKDDVKRQFGFNDEVWEKLGSDEKFIAAVREESLRRMRDGSTKREKAQQAVMKAPDVLSGIMLDTNASPKHRIDSAKVLDTFAANGPGVAPASERFVITINIGSDTLKFDKSIAVDANDVNLGSDSTLEESAFVVWTTRMPDIFERLGQSPQPEKEQPAEPEIVRKGPQPIIPPAHSKSSPSEKLLSWIVNFWPK